MQNIKQFDKERQEIKSLQTCESNFFTFPTKICGVSVKRVSLQKTVQEFIIVIGVMLIS